MEGKIEAFGELYSELVRQQMVWDDQELYFNGTVVVDASLEELVLPEMQCTKVLATSFGLNVERAKELFSHCEDVTIICNGDVSNPLPGIKQKFSEQHFNVIMPKGLSSTAIQHSKLIVLDFSSLCRIIISSENLTTKEYDQVYFIVDTMTSYNQTQTHSKFLKSLDKFILYLSPTKHQCKSSYSIISEWSKFILNNLQLDNTIDQDFKIIYSVPSKVSGINQLKSLLPSDDCILNIKSYSSSVGSIDDIISLFGYQSTKFNIFWPKFSQILNKKWGCLFTGRNKMNHKSLKQAKILSHAKIIHFHSTESDHIYIGSHNFSQAAWTGGNYELGVFCTRYDINSTLAHHFFNDIDVDIPESSLFSREEILAHDFFVSHEEFNEMLSNLVKSDELVLVVFYKKNTIFRNGLLLSMLGICAVCVSIDIKSASFDEKCVYYRWNQRLNSDNIMGVLRNRRIVDIIPLDTICCDTLSNFTLEPSNKESRIKLCDNCCIILSLLIEKLETKSISSKIDDMIHDITSKYTIIILSRLVQLDLSIDIKPSIIPERGKFLEHVKDLNIYVIQNVPFIGLMEKLKTLDSDDVTQFLARNEEDVENFDVDAMKDTLDREKLMRSVGEIKFPRSVKFIFSLCYHGNKDKTCDGVSLCRAKPNPHMIQEALLSESISSKQGNRILYIGDDLEQDLGAVNNYNNLSNPIKCDYISSKHFFQPWKALLSHQSTASNAISPQYPLQSDKEVLEAIADEWLDLDMDIDNIS